MNDFFEILKNHTSMIDKSYFQTIILDKKGFPKNIYRERVYCYELYHQMRKQWPNDNVLKLHGEFDKSGSQLFTGSSLKNVKPDFLVHVAGNVKNNFAAIEVKPDTASTRSIEIDLNKLSEIQLKAKFKVVLYLIFGEKAKHKAKKIHEIMKKLELKKPIQIWAHSSPNSAAEFVLNN